MKEQNREHQEGAGGRTYHVSAAKVARKILDNMQEPWRERPVATHEYPVRKEIGVILGDHPKAAIDNHFKTGHREPA